MNAIPDTECSLESLGADICIDDLPFFFQTGLQVRDVMTKSHVVASRQESMKSVAKMLESAHIPFVAIEDHGQIVGVVTEREIVAAIAARGLDLRATTVGEVMEPLGEGLSPVCPLSEASRFMRAQGRHWVPVLAGEDFVSVLTQEDLTRAATLLPELGPVREFMTTSVVQVDATASLVDAASVMSRRRLSCVVASHQGKAVGILTERDFLRQAVRVDPDASNVSVADVMAFPILSVSPDSSLSEARALMAKHHIRRLVIIDGHRPEGIITQTDIVSALHRKLEEDEKRRWHRLDASCNPVFAIDLDAKLNYANPAFLRLMGLDHPKEVLGRPFLPPQVWDDPGDRPSVLAALESHDIRAQEARLITSAGKTIRVVIFSSLNKNFRGEVIGKQGILWQLADQ